MKLPSSEKKIPGILGLFVLTLGLGVTLYLAGTTTNLLQHASPTETPSNIRITNISDTSFTVTFQTDTPLVGTITIGDTSSTVTVLDDRDQQTDTPKPYALHSITAKALQPDTTYSFSILSGTTIFLNSGQEFSVTTGASLSATPNQHILTGKIITPSGTTPDEALVYATLTNGQTLSTLTDASGAYTIPINQIRTSDLTAYAPVLGTTDFSLFVLGATDTSHATISSAATDPVPVITLGQNFDFTSSLTPLATSAAITGFPAFSSGSTFTATPKILTPATPNQTFSTQQPVFKGTALPNKQVTITIHSNTAIVQTVTADQDGNWSYQPTTPLAPGVHTITISTLNAAGILQTIQQSFTVFASAGQPSPTTALVADNFPTTIPTDTPAETSFVSPTPATTYLPIATVSATPTSLPSTGSDVTVIIGIVGIVTSLVGMLIFFLTQGAL